MTMLENLEKLIDYLEKTPAEEIVRRMKEHPVDPKIVESYAFLETEILNQTLS